MQICKYASTQVCKVSKLYKLCKYPSIQYAGIQVFNFAFPQVCGYAGMQVGMYAGKQVAGKQVCRFASMQVYAGMRLYEGM